MNLVPLSTTPNIHNASIDAELGIVTACAMTTTDFAGDLLAAMKNFIGGNVKNYEKLIDRATVRATEQIEKQAVERHADAVVGVRYHIEAIPLKKGVIVAVHISGTAVRLKPSAETPSPDLRVSPSL